MNSPLQNRAIHIGWFLVLLLCFCHPAYYADEAGTPALRAGAAAINITPSLGAPIVGNWKSPGATHIHDDLYARSLVLVNGEHRIAVVVCDNLYMDQVVYDQARRRLSEITSIPPEHMFMAATHTHSGPNARQPNCLKTSDELPPYQQFVADRIVDSIQCAINNLEPAEIGWGSGKEPSQVFNRRWHMSDPSLMISPFGDRDQVRMNPPRNHAALLKPAGPTDPEIVFLAVRSADKRPIALLANYSLHYVGGVPSGHISADYFGAFADRIQQLLTADRLDPPFVGILSNGTSGDINNINFRKPRPTREPYEQMNRVANAVAAEVYRALQTIEYHVDVKLDGELSALTLDVRRPDETTVQWAKTILERPEQETKLKERIYAKRTMMLHESPDQVDVWIQSLRIGDVGIAGIPFETFVETGLRLKKESPLPVTFTISFANGGFGYLPTPAQHKLGGYETWLGTSRVAPDSEPAIIASLLSSFDELAKEYLANKR